MRVQVEGEATDIMASRGHSQRWRDPVATALQLSGIGPGKLLKTLGIPVIVDRPGVGGNLQDHYQMRTIVRMKARVSLNNQVRDPFSLAKMGLDWAIRGADR